MTASLILLFNRKRKVKLQAQPMTVTVTGAAGKLGIHVCRALINAGHSVRATDKLSRQRVSLKIELADLLDREACYRVLAASDAVVHLANYSDMFISDSQKLFNENVAMNMNVFQAAQELGVRHIVFSSSIQVLGKQSSPDADPCACVPYLPLDGDAPANPCNAYALSKQVGEVMLQYFAQAQMNCVAIRYPWLIDPAKHDFSKRKSGLVKKVHGVFSYLSFDDAAKLIVAILGAPLPDFRIYMPAHPKNRLGRAAAEVVSEYYPSIPLRRPLDKIESLIDITRIQNETGWSPAGSAGPRD
jgi:nucleoside-diphosphate-sugar epimerase